ncbi:methyl-accepting chemotaxis protein [Marinibaculum pumilum]|uniref:Methyl-accepting chemotaxis protein n=1 Tax=Marinibaculum pumilum TaxID=1766165 RepID=A0ABV7KWJ9_9PROT
MKRIDNLPVAAKIALCAGSVLVLLMLVGAIAVIGLGTVQGNFGSYRAITERTTAASQLQSALLSAGIAIKDFMLTSSTASQERATADIQAAQDAVRIEGVDDPELAARVAAIREQLGAYDQAFRQVVPMQERRDRQVADLGALGAEADATALALLKRQRQLTNATATYNASMVMRNLLLAGLNIREFLATDATDASERAQEAFADTAKALKTLDRTVSDPEGQALVDTMGGLLERYTALFSEVVATIQQRNQIIAEQVETIGPALAAQMEEARQRNSSRLAEVGDATVAEADRIQWLTVGAIVLAVILSVLLAFGIGRSIARPIRAMTGAMSRLAEGDTETQIPAQDRGDEIGEMAEAVQIFKDNMIRNEEMAATQRREQEEREQRTQAIEALTRDFDGAVADVLAQLGAATQEMQATAASMSNTAGETSRQANMVAAASEQASGNVQTVAAAAEELSSSIEEIARQVNQSATIAGRASEDARRTNAQVDGLAQAAQKIGEVVSLIQDIAEQTNLLALNATIEAARAGEAGKGFAVVASEVKNLATQTARATEQISQQIAGIQSETGEAVSAIQGIGRTIGEVNDIATSIAAAVEQQGAATQEISRNVQEAAHGTREVTSNIGGVTQAAGEAGGAAETVKASASAMAAQSQRLSEAVEQFLIGVRAA